jgi:hypothetical protein
LRTTDHWLTAEVVAFWICGSGVTQVRHSFLSFEIPGHKMPFSCLSSIRIFASAIYFCLRHLSPPQGTNRDEKKLNLELAGTPCSISWSQNALLTASFSQKKCLRQAGAPEGAPGITAAAERGSGDS